MKPNILGCLCDAVGLSLAQPNLQIFTKSDGKFSHPALTRKLRILPSPPALAPLSVDSLNRRETKTCANRSQQRGAGGEGTRDFDRKIRLDRADLVLFTPLNRIRSIDTPKRAAIVCIAS